MSKQTNNDKSSDKVKEIYKDREIRERFSDSDIWQSGTEKSESYIPPVSDKLPPPPPSED